MVIKVRGVGPTMMGKLDIASWVTLRLIPPDENFPTR